MANKKPMEKEGSKMTASVAQTTTLSPDENVPIYYKLYDYITLLSYDESVLKSANTLLEEMLSYFENVSCSKNRTNIIRHLCKYIADSPQVIVEQTEIPEQSAYREIKYLVKNKFI